VKKIPDELCKNPETCPNAFLGTEELLSDGKSGSIDRLEKTTLGLKSDYLRLSLNYRKGEASGYQRQFILGTKYNPCGFVCLSVSISRYYKEEW
jgi:hypothetical protein